MSFNDEELTALGMQKKTAFEYKQACKREVDSAKAYLNSFDARIDGAWSKAERRSLIDAKRTAKADFFQKLADLREANAQLTSANEQFQRRLDELKEQSARNRQTGTSNRNWQPGGRNVPPDVGIIAETGQEVSFKTGDNDHVLIRDGDYGNHDDSPEGRRRAAEFNRRGHHDHYGNDDRTGRRFEKTRGYHNDPPEKG